MEIPQTNRIRSKCDLGLIFVLLVAEFFGVTLGNLTLAYQAGCEDEPLCLKCSPMGCIKCPQYIAVDSRSCIDECSRGYTGQWSTMPDFMGRICRPTGLTGPFLAAVVGIIAGIILCGALIMTSIYLVRRRKRRKSLQETLIDDTIERTEFLRQLDEFRSNAEHFLAMLNDTRRQIRKLHLSGDTTGVMAYRPIVRDLAKILLLLNRPIDLLSQPHDWSRLHTWAQRVLERYKPQIAQLIDFLQTPNLSADPRLATCQHHTFKSTTTTSTNASESPNLQLQSFGSLISLHEFEEQRPPPAGDLFGSAFNSLKYCSNRSSEIHSSSIWLEDEFFKLGFRPQDEITTEL